MTTREWGPMFRQASRVKPGAEAPRLPHDSTSSKADFGTDLMNNHTAREISDLVDNKQTEIDDVTNHVHTMPASKDPAWVTWSADWGKFVSDWTSAATSARTFVKSVKDNPNLATATGFLTSPITWLTQSNPLDQVVNESLYQSLLAILQPQGAGTSRVQDLYRRYQSLPSVTPIPFRPLPKPYQKDGSLDFRNKLPDVPNPLDPADIWKKIPWWAWAAGGTLVLGAGVTVLKASPVGLLFKVLR